jgi:uracil-DNA glycosylase
MATWQAFIHSEMEKPYFQVLSRFLAKEAKNHTIYPPKDKIFAAFDACPLEKVKCVILGADPYHSIHNGKPIAHGLSFSVERGVPIPPSLRNIFRELQDDLGIEPPGHGCLERWGREEGILLLNSALTVRAGSPGSHSKQWQEFTDNAIRLVNNQDRCIVHLLWGSHARSKRALITNPKHLVCESAHPSPLSAYNGFFGCKHFSKTNEYLVQNGVGPIDWRIE